VYVYLSVYLPGEFIDKQCIVDVSTFSHNTRTSQVKDGLAPLIGTPEAHIEITMAFCLSHEGVRNYLYPGCDTRKKLYALDIIVRKAQFVTSPLDLLGFPRFPYDSLYVCYIFLGFPVVSY